MTGRTDENFGDAYSKLWTRYYAWTCLTRSIIMSVGEALASKQLVSNWSTPSLIRWWSLWFIPESWCQYNTVRLCAARGGVPVWSVAIPHLRKLFRCLRAFLSKLCWKISKSLEKLGKVMRKVQLESSVLGESGWGGGDERGGVDYYYTRVPGGVWSRSSRLVAGIRTTTRFCGTGISASRLTCTAWLKDDEMNAMKETLS